MTHVSPQDYQSWMRERFPMLNKSIDDGRSADLQTLQRESGSACETMVHDTHTNERERFTYIAMIHSALYHHKVNESAMQEVEARMANLASQIGVEHRFLSAFYLFHNPEIPDLNGKFAQFRPTEYETAFLRINREGTLQYKLGAKALLEAHRNLMGGLSSFESLKLLLEQAAAAFRKISKGNAMLLSTPGGEEFRDLTQYFGEVRVADGPPLRGVNAGDQPWSYIIDLLIGVNLKHVFEIAFQGTPNERHYSEGVRTSADVVSYEFRTHEYLRGNYLLPEDYSDLTKTIEWMNEHPDAFSSAVQKSFSGAEQIEIATRLHEVIRQYLAASNVHYQLAKRHVPKNAEGEQIGSAGTNIVKFLKEGLNAEREKVKSDLERQYPELFEKQKTETTIA